MMQRMADFFPSEAEFLFEQEHQFDAPLSEELWAQLVFIDPISIVPKLSAASSYGDSLTGKELTALYADWQTRESEIGYALVERRKHELRASLECYRASLDRRQRTISSARARLQTIQRINATEPDISLRYPAEIIDVLDEKIRTSEAENQYLRIYTSRMAALANVLHTMGATGRSDVVEQYCRLIGHTWRGQMKLRAFQKKFPAAIPRLEPAEGIQAIIAGDIIHNAAAESPFNTDIVLPHVTVAYLRHLLNTIASLAENARSIFDPNKQPAHLNGEWPPVMILLSAIVELFYYCSFEMGYSSYGRVVEQVSASRVWDFNPQIKDWQQFSEKSMDQLRRQSSETAMLLVEYPPFLRCTNPEDVSNACQAALSRIRPSMLTQAYGAYQFAGLARMEQRADSRSFKYHNAGALTGMVLDHAVSLELRLKNAFITACGGPMQTLVGMANLDPKAYGLAGGEELLPRQSALKVLSNFWKRMGKKRPVALLGDAYAKGIYAGMASIGEAAPEFSSLLSIHLTNVFGTNLFGTEPGKGLQDLLNVLMLADQIRLVDLLELSWSYTQAVISDLQTVRTLSEVGELIKSGGTFSRFEPEIAKRFNQKWLNATQPLWTILRSTAPHAWGFWAKLSGGSSVAQLLGGVDPGQALGFLLLPLADIARLMLMFETSSPVLAERQKVDAETAARDLLAGFAMFREWPGPLSSIIEEHLSYYFDSTVQHDVWLSFTESFKQHMDQIKSDLQARQASAAIIDMLSTVIMRLDANYPSPQRAAAAHDVVSADEEQAQLPDCELAENDCQFLQTLCRDLIGERALTHIIFLKTLALWRYQPLRDALRAINEFRKPLRELLDEQSLRVTILSAPPVVRRLGELLQGSKGDVIEDSAAAEIINCLTEKRELQHQLEALMAMPTLPFDEDLHRVSELSVKTNGERAELLMVAFSNVPSFVLANEEEPATALLRYEAELKGRAERQFPNWKPEPLLLGAVTLTASRAGLALSNSRLEVDPIFHEPDKPGSARMLWTFASNKFGLALRLLQAELRDAIVSIRL
jgi:hypothetical protein